MDLSISEQQELLLYKACEMKGGRLTIELARSMYSSKNSAQSAIDKLKLAGFIERIAPGRWKVVKVTRDIKEELSHNTEDSSGSSDEKYSIEAA